MRASASHSAYVRRSPSIRQRVVMLQRSTRSELRGEIFKLLIDTMLDWELIVFSVGGHDFGERALVTNEPRSATVMTTTPTDLLVVDREVFSRWEWKKHTRSLTVLDIEISLLYHSTLKSAHEKELQEKTDFINRSPFFATWSARLKRLVSLSLERGRFAYDSILYKQGSPADAVYFIWR